MDASRNDLIRDILTVFDTVDQLRFDNRRLREKLEAYESTEPVERESIGFYDEKLLEDARKNLFKECFRTTYTPTVELDEDGNVLKLITFEQYVDGGMSTYYLPKWMSVQGYKDYFDVELHALYERRCAEAIESAKHEEE